MKALAVKAIAPSKRKNMNGAFLPLFLEIRMNSTCGNSDAPDMMLLMNTLPVKFPTLKLKP